MRYALIKNGLVKNIIEINTAEFLDNIRGSWDALIDVSNADPSPALGWNYINDTFSPAALTPEEQLNRDRKERLKAHRQDNANIPIAGQALKDLLADILDEL